VTGQRLAGEIERQLRAVGDPERAEREKRYLKSELEHAGASVPAIRKIAKAALADHPTLGHDELVDLVIALWGRPLHECRFAAVELLELRSDALRPADMELVERLIRESRTWALVDGLAASVAGMLVERYPELSKTLDRWSSDEDFWVQRSALLALLVPLRRGEGDFARFGRYADSQRSSATFTTPSRCAAQEGCEWSPSSTTTRCPAPSRTRTSASPRWPELPVTRILMPRGIAAGAGEPQAAAPRPAAGLIARRSEAARSCSRSRTATGP
jgi:3-methyladenine DNA glycosylase AlkD